MIAIRAISVGLSLLFLAKTGVGGSLATPDTAETPLVWFTSPDASTAPVLRSGQIIVTDSGGPTAVFFSLFSHEFSPFVHAGIIAVERGEFFVYESYGLFRLSLSGRPTDHIKGAVSRTPLPAFIQRGRYAKVYEPPVGADPDLIVRYAVEHFEKKTPFDPYFRFDEHDAFYCTEFVALAIEAAGGGLPPLESFPANPSLTRVRDWLGISDVGTVQARQLIDSERLVTTLSALRTQTRFLVYIELKREIHRRFTADQKLGNLFEWTGKNLAFREPIVRFMTQGLQLYETDQQIPDATRIAADVRRLAESLFGVMPADVAVASPPGHEHGADAGSAVLKDVRYYCPTSTSCRSISDPIEPHSVCVMEPPCSEPPGWHTPNDGKRDAQSTELTIAIAPTAIIITAPVLLVPAAEPLPLPDEQ